MWQSTDPAMKDYLPEPPNWAKTEMNWQSMLKENGVFEPKNIALYTYSHNRPLVLKDPNGRTPVSALQRVREQRALIVNSAERWGVDPVGLGSIVFQEKLYPTGAYLKNVAAYYANGGTPQSQRPGTSFGAAEIELRHYQRYAAEVQGRNIGIAEAYEMSQNDALSIDVAAWNSRGDQASLGQDLNGGDMARLHNFGVTNYRDWQGGASINTEHIASKSYGYQNAIRSALFGERIIPFPDFYYDQQGFCGSHNCYE